jgi:hypothetical protein
MCNQGPDIVVRLSQPQPVSGRTEMPVDGCIAPLVQLLNDAGVHTVGCCCGHGQHAGSVLYEQDGSLMEIRLPKPLGFGVGLWPGHREEPTDKPDIFAATYEPVAAPEEQA